MQGKVAKHSRHLYDIYKLLPLVPQDDHLKNLVSEVRKVRSQSKICLSAQNEIQVPILLKEIIQKKVYKNDYDKLTMQLLEEQIPYETAIQALEKISDSTLFANENTSL